jgi:uncharacterized membrane protein
MDTNRDNVILEELHKEYDRDTDLRKHTEGKANTIITFSGVILTLLLAFIALVFDKIMFTDEYLSLLRSFLIAIILAIGTSLILSIMSVILGRNFNMASAIGILATLDGHVNLPGIEHWRDAVRDEREFLTQYTRIYIGAILNNSKQREKKAKRVLWSQILLIIGISLIAVVIGLTIFLGSPRPPAT